jgi:Ca2+-binding RTX toxin-like protein
MTVKIWKAESAVANSGYHSGRPVVTMLPNGGYVVAWHDLNTKELYVQVYDGNGMMVDANGAASGTAWTIRANAQNGGVPQNISVLAIDDQTGDFAITWSATRDGNLSNTWSLKTQVFNADGTPKFTTPTDIETSLSRDQHENVAMARHGSGYVVAYNSTDRASGKASFELARYNEKGEPVGEQITLNLPDQNEIGLHPDLIRISDDKYLLVYAAGGSNVKVYVVNPASPNPSQAITVGLGASNSYPDIVPWNGGFAVIYHTNGNKILLKTYNAEGVEGDDFEIANSAYSDGSAPKPHETTVLKDGRIALVYSSYTGANNTNDNRIVLKILDPNSQEVVTETFVLPPPTNPWLFSPRITEMADGRLALTWWSGNGNSGLKTTIIDARDEGVNVTGTLKNDIYHGSEYNDILKGRDGNDALYGGDGNDKLHGGTGADRFDGGNGQDTVTYEDAVAGVHVYMDPAKGRSSQGEALGPNGTTFDTFFSIEVIDGSVHNDLLEGAGSNDTFWGNTGNDLLKGMGGNDTLKGAGGSDTLYGGLGRDTFIGSDDNNDTGWDTVTYEFSNVGVVIDLAAVNLNTKEAEGDTYSGIEAFVGSMGHDVMRGLNDATKGDSFLGKAGNDLLVGRDGNDTLNGDADNDTLQGGLGADELIGGAGNDFVSYADYTSSVTVGLADDGSGVAVGDNLKEIEGIIGGSSHDVLTGNRHSNTLEGGAGNDILDGGDGFDFASYASSTQRVVIALPSGVAVDVNTNSVNGIDRFTLIEGLIGSNHGDSLTGNEIANVLRGEGGNDVLAGRGGNDTLDGGAGVDTVDYSAAGGSVTVNLANGTGAGSDAGGDTYSSIENAVGSSFDDVFIGNGAANAFQGLGGNDTYHVTAGDTVVEAAGGGIDKVVTDVSYNLGANIEDLQGTGGGALALTGNGLNNTITGNAAGNWIDGGIGADTMAGGAGDDTYVIDNAGDRIIDDLGVSSVVLTVNYDLSLLPASVQRITMAEGLPLNLTGTNGANVLMGNIAANTLKGQGGNDKLYGKASNDKLYGGSGKDVFVFDTKTHMTRNVDKIYDFKSKDDSIWLDNAVFTKLGRTGSEARPKKFSSDMFVNGTKAQDREDRIVYDKKTGNLYYDADGTGRSAQVKIATIVNKTTLKFDDFFVI